MTDTLPLHSPHLVNQNIARIAALFPNCITETANGKAIDFDLLKQALNTDIIEGSKERYRLEWAGKREAIVTANLPTNNTLRPIKADSVNFDTTENLYIEGDNLEVLKLLQESYLGKVKMIYIDPPYNTGNDFIYEDNFIKNATQSNLESGLIDEQGNKLKALRLNPETSGRYHSDWLTMIYPRLKLARNLLSDDGVIFISIDDNEVHNLRKVCDEIFGEGNFIAQLIWKSKSGGANDSKYFAVDHEYLLCYSKNVMNFSLKSDKNATVTTVYNLEDEHGKYGLDRLDKQSLGYLKSLDFPIVGLDGKEYKVLHKNENIKVARWRWGQSTVNERYKELVFKDNFVYTKNYEKDGSIPRSILFEDRFGRTRTGKTDFTSLFDSAYFSSPKPVKLLRHLLEITSNQNSIILDFFSGSATTAHAVMQLNAEDGGSRKFIMVQVPETTDEKSEAYKAGYKNICEIGKERIRRAGKKIQQTNANIDNGFRVYRLDSSNMHDVYYTPQDYKQDDLDLFANNIKSDRTAEDLLTQIMLSWGLPLHYTINTLTIQGKQVLVVDQNSLFACFDTEINEAFAKEIATHQPLRIVFKDDSFKDDTAKENVKQLLKQLSPDTKMKVI